MKKSLMVNENLSYLGCLVIISLALLLGGCATGKNQQAAAPEAAPAVTVPPLSKAYQEIVVFDFETTPALEKDYTEAIKECRNVLVSTLQKTNRFRRVEAGNSDTASGGTPRLLVKIKLNDMRIAGFGARFWGGAFAGSSYMYLHMKLMDASTREIVREEAFNSTNNSWAATWNFGASDRSLPSDMGQIMAAYLEKAVPLK